MYHSYVMGIDHSILELRKNGFLIQPDGENYTVSFPEEAKSIWEDFIQKHLSIGYWNEYLTKDGAVFTFHLPEGFRRYQVENFEQPEVLSLCETLCECKFGSLKAMLSGNHFYARILHPKIKWLFFDVGTTLVDETEAYNHRIRDAIAKTDITFEQVQQKRVEFQKQNLKGDLEAIRFFGLPLTAWHKEDEMPYPDAADTLQYLKEKGYRIGVIANQSPGTKERLEQYGLLSYIDLIVASAEMGLSKPDPQIFLEALRQADCIPEEAIMIGDRLDNDIIPAKKLGMHTIWAKQGFAVYQSPTGEADTPNHTIERLAELKYIF